MRPTILLFIFCVTVSAQNNHRELSSKPDLLKPQSETENGGVPNLSAPASPRVGQDLPDRFDLGVFSKAEQVHDTEIARLDERVYSLESRINEARGVFWGFGVFFGLVISFIGVFWRGILKLMLNEVSTPKVQIYKD